MGQNCCAASRTFVQEKIYDKFVEKSAKLASQKKVGDQFDSSTEVWPLVKFKIPFSLLNEYNIKIYYDYLCVYMYLCTIY